MKNLAVIFDVDGVLIDSYRAHFEAWLRAGRTWGFSVTEEQFAATFGRTSREVIVDTFGLTWLSESHMKQLDEQKEAFYREIVTESFPVMEGASELLDSLLAAGFHLAIGSSGPPLNVDVVLDHLRRRNFFGKVVTGADVTRGKPDPQVFLLGAQGLGVSPKNCAVIEDAAPGIVAARKAGMKAIGFLSTGRYLTEFSEAHVVVRSLRELNPERIAALILDPNL